MRNKITLDEFTEEIEQIGNVLDQTRTIGLGQANRLMRARGAATAREVARLRARHGTREPETLDSAATLIVNAGKSAQLASDIRATRLLRRVSPDNTIALGRVVMQKGQSLKGLQVAMAVRGGSTIARGDVDSSGLYLIRLGREEFNRLIAKGKELSFTVQDAEGHEFRQVTLPVSQDASRILVVHFDLTKERPSKPAPPRPTPAPGPAPTTGRVPTPSLSDIRGLGPARIARLKDAGVTDLAALTSTQGPDLADILKVSLDQATDFIGQARTLLREN